MEGYDKYFYNMGVFFTIKLTIDLVKNISSKLIK